MPTEFAKLILESRDEQRRILVRDYTATSAEAVAKALQELCFEVWTNDPQKIQAIAEALDTLADQFPTFSIRGYAEWTRAIRLLVAGDVESCIKSLDLSESLFVSAERAHLAAKTQTSKLYALALLGRYDEAVECGGKALQVFLDHDDIYSAGKIEHNIGNLFWRRDLYRESEPFLESAHRRFLQIDDQRQLAMVENCQAFVKTLQNDFRGAEEKYNRSLERAVKNDLTVTAAEIEIGLSNLNLFRGDYEKALRFLEQARHKYEDLEMLVQTANCELEIADIYLELNLLSEAVSFYEKGEQGFSALSGQAELARANLGHGRALERLGDKSGAASRLNIAKELFAKEGNSVGVGYVQLVRSQHLMESGDLDEAEGQVDQALTSFRAAGNLRLELFARWLKCEIRRALGLSKEAGIELREILELAKNSSNEIYYLSLVSLGKISGDPSYFRKAIEIVEMSRVGLASAELRTAYFTEKLAPYEELVKQCLKAGDTREAFRWHERSRSRSMSEAMTTSSSDIHSDVKLRKIREELNWTYWRLKQADIERSKHEQLKKKAGILEARYAETLRRLYASDGPQVHGGAGLEISELREQLRDATLLEFFIVDGKLSVFVISKGGLSVLENYVSEDEINAQISQYLFQLKTGRFIDRLSPANRKAAGERLLTHSRRLYEMILKPVEQFCKTRRLVIAPARQMHYLPFHALQDGDSYLIERFSISYTPSATMLSSLLQHDNPERTRALIGGIADSAMPKAIAEVEGISSFFREPELLIGQDLTSDNLRRLAKGKGVVHLACHGHFRHDNPGFSSLDLFGEKMTANEISTLTLQRCMIVLSSCEGGLNQVAPGEELIGLTGAFFSAGASTIVHSLWRVSDDAALELMPDFYKAIASGIDPADAMREAQLARILSQSHPYLWAPFIVSGRW